jgi:hypothetical protein
MRRKEREWEGKMKRKGRGGRGKGGSVTECHAILAYMEKLYSYSVTTPAPVMRDFTVYASARSLSRVPRPSRRRTSAVARELKKSRRMNAVDKGRSVFFYASYIFKFRTIRTFQFHIASLIVIL